MRFVLPALVFAGACQGNLGPTATQPTLKTAAVFAGPETNGLLGASGKAIQQGVPAKPIRHHLSFEDRALHYADVRSTFAVDGRESLVLMMPVWTPGSYMVRDYAGLVQDFVAQDANGKVLLAEKTAKNRWTIQSKGLQEVTVRYRLYAFVASVRNNLVDSEMAVLNGAATFLVPVDGLHVPHEVEVQRPTGWSEVITGLAPVQSKGHLVSKFWAQDFDELVDCPIAVGSPAVYEFKIDGVSHRLANFGEAGVWKGKKSAADVEAITREQIKFWGQMPYKDYTYINVLGEKGGGLEHKNSTLMMANRWFTHDRKDYTRWLGLVSHEFFHTWNVKRLRPVTLGPFDYEREVHTPSLWIAEGLTSYYDDVLLARAGLLSQEEYLEKLAGNVERLQSVPGRLVQSVEMASYDAWIKLYHRHEDSANTTVSYYTKGAVIGFVLDAKIRALTDGQKSLDDVMRTAYTKFSGDKGYTREDFWQVISDVAGQPMDDFLRPLVQKPQEVPLDEALAYYGLALGPAPEKQDGKKDGENDDNKEEDAPKAYLGVKTQGLERITVDAVVHGSPAAAAGVSAGDELLAINGFRIKSDGFEKLLHRHDVGEKVTVLVSREGMIRTLEATLSAPPPGPEAWKVRVREDATEEQKARLKAWLL